MPIWKVTRPQTRRWSQNLHFIKDIQPEENAKLKAGKGREENWEVII
jgi:hypothetical protein